MKALVFGAPPDPAERRPEPADDRERELLALPFGLHDMPDATPIRRTGSSPEPLLSGVCGSDAKLVMGDFNAGDIDNPMSAFSSLPHVPGHEVVAEVVSLGPDASGIEPGQRVVLNPWLTCAPRGVEPVCPACAAGDLSLCLSFTKGPIGPGVHIGVTTGAPGAWADLLAAHDSMLIPVPDGITNEAAVLADPFAVSLHAIVRHPPPPGGKALVYGAGALGVTSVAAIKALYPDVEVAVVARFEAQRELARHFGASFTVGHEPRTEVVEALADWSGGELHAAFDGLPVAKPGGIDVVYDTIARPGDSRGRRQAAEGTGDARTDWRVDAWALRVDADLLQGTDSRRLQCVRFRRGRGLPQARHRPLPGPGCGGARRPDRDAHPPIPARRLVGRPACSRAPRSQRSDQGGVRARRLIPA